MADEELKIKISELGSLNPADIQSNDKLVIVDASDISSASTGTTKSLSPDAFVKPVDVFLKSDHISNFTGTSAEPVITNVNGKLDSSLLDTETLQSEIDNTYSKDEFIDDFTGLANQPIITNLSGLIPPDLVDVLTFRFIDQFTPTGGAEYPDTTGQTAGTGATWIVEGVGAGYTFIAGDLAGETVYNDAWMVFGADNWILMHNVIAGSDAIWGSIQGNLADQTDLQNALNQKVTGPTDALESRFALFNGTSGKVIKDDGIILSDVASGPSILWSSNHIVSQLDNKASDAVVQAHLINYNNPHQVDASDIGLENADNTSDANKPVSDATQTALNLKADKTEVAITTGSPSDITNQWVGTQAEYDLIGTKSPTTIYNII